MELQGMRVAILVADMFEESELKQPKSALEKAGAEASIIAFNKGRVQSANHFEKGSQYTVEVALEDAAAEDYDGLLLPGGALSADLLRENKLAQEFARQIDAAGKPIAVICHGPWLLVSAGLVRGRCMTSYSAIKDDLVNAGAIWSDQPVVKDRNWVSSRKPDDLPAFNKAAISLFANAKSGALNREMAFRERLGRW